MKITFLGTRGNIKIKSRAHKRHTVTVIEYKKIRVAIDCGLDWLGHLDEIVPDAVVITHAHTDHVDGLRDGIDCPVYATKASWQRLRNFPLDERYIITPRVPFNIGSLKFEPFFVQHSLRAPAVGYRITGGTKTLFCVHDLITIKGMSAALKQSALYIGDGASFTRPIIRYKNGKPFGHTTIKEQIKWCQKEKVPRAIFTHCGSQIVRANQTDMTKRIAAYGAEHDVIATIAYDGMNITL